MKSPRTLLLIVLAAGSALVAVREYLELRELREEGMTPDERARLQKAAWDAEARARRLASQLETARSAPAAAAAAADPGRSLADSNVLGNLAAEYLGRMQDPEIRRLMDLQRLAGLNRQYAAFFKQARLSPDQLKQFQTLMLERQNAVNDVLLAATQQGINPMDDPQEFRQMVQNAQADVDGQIKSALGPDTYAQLQSFQQAQGQRNLVNQLQTDLSYTEAPLSGSQRDQVAQIIAQTNPQGGSTVSDQTLSLAQGVLSEPQMQALRNLQQLQQANRQLQNLMTQRRAAP